MLLILFYIILCLLEKEGNYLQSLLTFLLIILVLLISSCGFRLPSNVIFLLQYSFVATHLLCAVTVIYITFWYVIEIRILYMQYIKFILPQMFIHFNIYTYIYLYALAFKWVEKKYAIILSWLPLLVHFVLLCINVNCSLLSLSAWKIF